MDISVTEAKDRLTELIRTVEKGETVIITRYGKPVAQNYAATTKGEKVRWDTMRGRIHMNPRWDRPLTVDEFLSGDF